MFGKSYNSIFIFFLKTVCVLLPHGTDLWVLLQQDKDKASFIIFKCTIVTVKAIKEKVGGKSTVYLTMF